jgi:hypothetical protein
LGSVGFLKFGLELGEWEVVYPETQWCRIEEASPQRSPRYKYITLYAVLYFAGDGCHVDFDTRVFEVLPYEV